MTGKHYGWHRHWVVDVEKATATHENGLVARFLALPLTDTQAEASASDTAIGQCWTPDGREWGIVTTPAIQHAVFEALKATHGLHNAGSMFARLAREAGEAWAWHKQREH